MNEFHDPLIIPTDRATERLRMTSDPEQLLHEIQKSADGLLFPSETDSVISPVRLGNVEPTADVLPGLLGIDGSTPIETTTFESFFEGLTEAAEDASEDDRQNAQRFGNLRNLLARELDSLRVVRVGKVDIDVFVLGLHRSGEWMGIRTHVVES